MTLPHNIKVPNVHIIEHIFELIKHPNVVAHKMLKHNAHIAFTAIHRGPISLESPHGHITCYLVASTDLQRSLAFKPWTDNCTVTRGQTKVMDILMVCISFSTLTSIYPLDVASVSFTIYMHLCHQCRLTSLGNKLYVKKMSQ